MRGNVNNKLRNIKESVKDMKSIFSVSVNQIVT